MSFDASKLNVTYAQGVTPDGPALPRRYTLTHSDLTGELFLHIGRDYDKNALRTLQVRLERDEVLAEWVRSDGEARLELHMAAQGGLPIFGSGAMRCNIFRRFKPMVLEAIRSAEGAFCRAHPELEGAPVVAVFHWRRGREERETWGRWGEPRG